MKTIIVDHDTATEIHLRARFNNIVPLLRTYGFPEECIITPTELPKYLHTDNKIFYLITARIPPAEVTNGEAGDAAWLDEICTEIPDNIIRMANDGLLHISYFVGEIINLSTSELVKAAKIRIVGEYSPAYHPSPRRIFSAGTHFQTQPMPTSQEP